MWLLMDGRYSALTGIYLRMYINFELLPGIEYTFLESLVALLY